MTARELLAEATHRLKAAGCATPRLDAEVLLMHAWGSDMAHLVINMDARPDAPVVRAFQAMIGRRAHREPVAYITGEKEFWSRPFHITPEVLIPRPETEHLIEAVLSLCPKRRAAYRFCDIGTGSGCIAVTLACEYPNAMIAATDISDAALEIACGNATRHTVRERITFYQGDLFDALSAGAGGFDAIICNPPYVSLDEFGGLEPELAFEPRAALTDEADGLQYLRKLIEQAPAHLKPGGRLIVETGLCGLPEGTEAMHLERKIFDLAGCLRGGIYSCP